jgi:hypothetical protein
VGKPRLPAEQDGFPFDSSTRKALFCIEGGARTVSIRPLDILAKRFACTSICSKTPKSWLALNHQAIFRTFRSFLPTLSFRPTNSLWEWSHVGGKLIKKHSRYTLQNELDFFNVVFVSLERDGSFWTEKIASNRSRNGFFVAGRDMDYHTELLLVSRWILEMEGQLIFKKIQPKQPRWRQKYSRTICSAELKNMHVRLYHGL